jgi:hypothetical protein
MQSNSGDLARALEFDISRGAIGLVLISGITADD